MRINKTQFNKKVGVIIDPEVNDMLDTIAHKFYRNNKSWTVEECIKLMYNHLITKNETSTK